MNAEVRWLAAVRDVFWSLPAAEQDAIDATIQRLRRNPYMYQIWERSRRFRRYRQFIAGNWRVFYRVVDDVIWIRGLWPARMPVRLVKRGSGKLKP